MQDVGEIGAVRVGGAAGEIGGLAEQRPVVLVDDPLRGVVVTDPLAGPVAQHGVGDVRGLVNDLGIEPSRSYGHRMVTCRPVKA